MLGVMFQYIKCLIAFFFLFFFLNTWNVGVIAYTWNISFVKIKAFQRSIGKATQIAISEFDWKIAMTRFWLQVFCIMYWADWISFLNFSFFLPLFSKQNMLIYTYTKYKPFFFFFTLFFKIIQMKNWACYYFYSFIVKYSSFLNIFIDHVFNLSNHTLFIWGCYVKFKSFSALKCLLQFHKNWFRTNWTLIWFQLPAIQRFWSGSLRSSSVETAFCRNTASMLTWVVTLQSAKTHIYC